MTSPAVWETAGAFFTLPDRAHQVSVRFFTVSGHEYRDVVLLADDYLQRKQDGSITAYLKDHVIPRLKKDWYPFPVDSGDRWVLPVMLAGGVYVEDPDAPNPLDRFSVSFSSGSTEAPDSHVQRAVLASAEVGSPNPGEADDGCGCAGRDEGKHDMLCESSLRRAFGGLENAPEDVKRMLGDRNRPVPETAATAWETGAGALVNPVQASFPDEGTAVTPADAGRPRRSAIAPSAQAARQPGPPGPA